MIQLGCWEENLTLLNEYSIIELNLVAVVHPGGFPNSSVNHPSILSTFISLAHCLCNTVLALWWPCTQCWRIFINSPSSQWRCWAEIHRRLNWFIRSSNHFFDPQLQVCQFTILEILWLFASWLPKLITKRQKYCINLPTMPIYGQNCGQEEEYVVPSFFSRGTVTIISANLSFESGLIGVRLEATPAGPQPKLWEDSCDCSSMIKPLWGGSCVWLVTNYPTKNWLAI